MEKDIVERLRSDGEDERQRFREARATLGHLLNEAADEIEKLRKQLSDASWSAEKYRNEVDDGPKW